MLAIQRAKLFRVDRRQAGCLVAAILLIGCDEQNHQVVVRLEVSKADAYSIDGTPVDQSQLVEALQAKHQPDRKLLVHVVPSQGASYNAVQRAVAACQQVGASVGMVGNELFHPQAASAPGA